MALPCLVNLTNSCRPTMMTRPMTMVSRVSPGSLSLPNAMDGRWKMVGTVWKSAPKMACEPFSSSNDMAMAVIRAVMELPFSRTGL